MLVMAAQGVTKIVRQRVAAQFVRGTQPVVADDQLQLVVVDEGFAFAVEIEVDRNTCRARLDGVELGFERDDVVPYRAPQVRQRLVERGGAR